MTSVPPRVAAIVPAYNEQETLAEVLSVLASTPLIDEVIVVSDGSTDQTVEIARAMGVKTIHLLKNHGKGTAMAVGVAHTGAPILVFVDGDILNLTHAMLEELIRPVKDGRSEMNVGIRNRGSLLNAIHVHFGPLLSGIRCLQRKVFEAVPEEDVAGFAIETGLNWACAQLGARITTTVFFHLKHLVKEKKRGLVQGAKARCEMFAAVFRAYLHLVWSRPGLGRAGSQPLLATELEYINF
ncbi:MAG TPA: glycosyltransferase family 2 protein [Thermoanaerobaculia bacterium]|jgi:glycosyltransferase involved in cell wall biosynthesis|nr:glycosyltransferase family 2 protein [Thermoanaerobaculia bacterium]